MKKTILLLLFLLMFSACSEKSKKDVTETPILEKKESGIEGVWDLVSTYSYENNKVVDTFYLPPNPRMVKFFSKTKYMWSHKPKDSLEWHAYGTYELLDDTLVLKREYCSKTMEDHSPEVKLKLILKKDTFQQIHFDPNGQAFYAENYKRIE
ncbi:hypothetical protein [Flagellimonas sp. CMM7]|uniref:hypothetical protein n=1 Tax=Flagellimonas sp. CMM7 TaxID=2654676 RepID=UPI0013D3630E|nr:hypothetical protein [Flagellimonas sp. CMM7]UII81416.1 hypothetical protein LV704_07825 [Flagellimonas sp. CMM7]